MTTRSREELQKIVFDAIHKLAPEAELASLRGEVPLRDQIDLDSMDQLNVVVHLDKVLGIKTTESDYSKLNTLNGILDYLELQLGGAVP